MSYSPVNYFITTAITTARGRLSGILRLLGLLFLGILLPLKHVEADTLWLDADQRQLAHTSSVTLLPYVSVWAASADGLSVEEIDLLSQSGVAQFEYPDHGFSFGYSHREYWFRWQMGTDAGGEDTWWFQLSPTFLDYADLYIPEDGGYRHLRLGDHVPLTERPIPTRHFLAPLPLTAGESGTYYLRVASTSTITLDMRLWLPESYTLMAARENLLYGLMFGLIITAILVSLISGFWLRQVFFFVMAGYLLCNGLLHLTLNGYDQLLLYPESPHWNNTFLGVSAFGAIASVLALGLTFLQPERIYPRWSRLLWAVVGLAILGGLLSLVIWQPYLAMFMSLLGILALILASSTTIMMLRHRPREAGLLLLLFMPGFAVMFLQLVRNFGFLPMTFWTTHAWALMTVFQIPYTAVIVMFHLRAHELALLQEQEQTRLHRGLFSMIAHELRTPLAIASSALANIELQTAGSHPELQPRFQRANLSIKRLNGLIDNALAEDRLLDRGMALQCQWVTPGFLVDQVFALFRIELPHRLEVRIEVGEVELFVDPQWLGLALLNLLDNAVKYSPEGGVIRLGVWGDGKTVCFSVSDQGIGVPPEAAAHLKDKFYRAENARALQGVPGMGVGLFLVHTVAERHGGELVYQPVAGGGSIFILRLPMTNK